MPVYMTYFPNWPQIYFLKATFCHIDKKSLSELYLTGFFNLNIVFDY